MMPHKFIYNTLLFFVALSFSTVLQGQNSEKQKQLEAERQEIQKEITAFSKLISQSKAKEKSVLTAIENMNYKVLTLQNLIRITNQQTNLLTNEINTNVKTISTLKTKLQRLKDDYAKMIVKSYKSKSDQSKIMFLLSSSNFKQAYKRLQYIKQYATYKQQQGQRIKKETLALQDFNKTLVKQRQNKTKLIDENRIAKQDLNTALKQQEQLIASINKNLETYNAKIKTKQEQRDALDKEIDNIIKTAIAASNKKAGKSSKETTFALTPTERALSSDFSYNKGKLPWPVKRGIIKVRYGTQPSPINKNIPIQSNGIRIVTNRGEKVNAIFNGAVHSIIVPKNGNNTILIKHGNFYTVYKNLSEIYVKKGDLVHTGQEIGEVLTNRASGEAILSFLVYRDGKTQNPAHWIKKKG